MHLSFDIISDLNLSDNSMVDWNSRGTSYFCVVAGNVAADRNTLVDFLTMLGSQYQGVFFIDGPLEHSYFENYEESYEDLEDRLSDIPNVVYLHNNIIVLNGVGIVGVNGWSSFNFTTGKNQIDAFDQIVVRQLKTRIQCQKEQSLGLLDHHYLFNTVQKCQSIDDCIDIIVVSNSVPIPELIEHDRELHNTPEGDIIGNQTLTKCLLADDMKKVTHWVFGRTHDQLLKEYNGVKYLSNPLGYRELSTYFPVRIEF